MPIGSSPVPGMNLEAHGNYRGRLGVDLAVLTLSYLAPTSREYEYRTWASHRTLDLWLDNDGRSLLIAEGPELPTRPDQIQVTLNPVGNRGGAGAVPNGPPVVRWPAR